MRSAPSVRFFRNHGQGGTRQDDAKAVGSEDPERARGNVDLSDEIALMGLRSVSRQVSFARLCRFRLADRQRTETSAGAGVLLRDATTQRSTHKPPTLLHQ